MKRKVVKILIFLLFIIVFGLATVFAIKAFMPELFESVQTKYMVGPVGQMK
ncbi:hypothetical protein Dip510_000048 [Elusimicrobium posterum]|uniref:hypothetical protein n=1 Tax=Elusimicrobium posterum TaxID=3116653 RepID=UPI003C7944DF